MSQSDATITRIVVQSDGYQPNGDPIDLARVRPPQTPTGAFRPGVVGSQAKSQPSGRILGEKLYESPAAQKALDDTSYLAFCMVVAMKHFISLICKRWPNLS